MIYVGMDIGQRQDPSAIVVIEQRRDMSLLLRGAERVALGTPYPMLVEQLRDLVQSPRLVGQCCVAMDATGVGAPVVDLMRGARLGCEICAVTITSGASAHGSGLDWHVPKRDLIAGVQVLLERSELKIVSSLREAQTLVRELTDMQMKLKTGGGMRMGADGCGQHDDLVIALALACWRAGRDQGTRNGFRPQRLPGI